MDSFNVHQACDVITGLNTNLQQAIGNIRSTGKAQPGVLDQMQQWSAAIELQNSKIKQAATGSPDPKGATGATGATGDGPKKS